MRRENEGWEEEVKNKKVFEEIISEIFPYLMKTIKLTDLRSSMNLTNGKHKEFSTEEYHKQIAENTIKRKI